MEQIGASQELWASPESLLLSAKSTQTPGLPLGPSKPLVRIPLQRAFVQCLSFDFPKSPLR